MVSKSDNVSSEDTLSGSNIEVVGLVSNNLKS